MTWRILVAWLVLVPVVSAGEVCLSMPDATLQQVINDKCGWDHCEKDGAWKTSEGKASWVINEVLRPYLDTIVAVFSVGRYKDLAALNARLVIRYDVWPADWPHTGRGE